MCRGSTGLGIKPPNSYCYHDKETHEKDHSCPASLLKRPVTSCSPPAQVFVLVADPQGQILDCKEYLAPIITHHEAMLAFSPDSEWDESLYRLDFGTDGPAQVGFGVDCPASRVYWVSAGPGVQRTQAATNSHRSPPLPLPT